jgi:hypothetical protein
MCLLHNTPAHLFEKRIASIRSHRHARQSGCEGWHVLIQISVSHAQGPRAVYLPHALAHGSTDTLDKMPTSDIWRSLDPHRMPCKLGNKFRRWFAFPVTSLVQVSVKVRNPRWCCCVSYLFACKFPETEVQVARWFWEPQGEAKQHSVALRAPRRHKQIHSVVLGTPRRQPRF